MPLRKKKQAIKPRKVYKRARVGRPAKQIKEKLSKVVRTLTRPTRLIVQARPASKRPGSKPRRLSSPPVSIAHPIAEKMGARPSSAVSSFQESLELASEYGETRIRLLVRDPYWTHAYWEVTAQARREIESRTGRSWQGLRKVLRVYDVTGVSFTGFNAHRSFDVEINDPADHWYLQVGRPDRAWCVDLGVITGTGEFILIARSNIVHTPPDAPSSVIDEAWGISEEEFYKLYALSGGGRLGLGSLELQRPPKAER